MMEPFLQVIDQLLNVFQEIKESSLSDDAKRFCNSVLIWPAGHFEWSTKTGEYLKLTCFVAFHSISDKELFEKDAPKKFAEVYKSLKPLNDFLNAPFL